MIRYEDNGKIAYFNDVKYIRDDRTGYYQSNALKGKNGIGQRKTQRLHRVVYIFYKGEIPEGYHVHHKDHDKSNNDISNLVIIKKGSHMKLHGIEKSIDEEWLKWSKENLKNNAIPKANEWHGSKEGREWHKKHYKECKDKLYKKEKRICDYCKKEFMSLIRKGDRFCSNKCKSAWRRKSGVDDIKRTCAYCKKEFYVNKYYKTECCSMACSNRLKPRLPQLRNISN